MQAVDQDEHLAALTKFGATPEQLEQARAQLQQRNTVATFGVWPENQRAVELLCAMSTQWIRHIGPGGAHYQGLRYEVLAEVERRLVPAPGTFMPSERELFWQLQVLEREAKDHLNSR